MYCAYPTTGSGNPLMYYYNGKTVYTPSSSSEGHSAPYSSGRAPNIVFTSSLLDGTNGSPDLWSSSNGISHSGQGGMLGASSSSQTQSGNYGSLPSHDLLNFPPHSGALAEVNRSLPPMSTFHRSDSNKTLASQTTPARDTGSFMAVTQGSGSSQTGDALGKALASVSGAASWNDLLCVPCCSELDCSAVSVSCFYDVMEVTHLRKSNKCSWHLKIIKNDKYRLLFFNIHHTSIKIPLPTPFYIADLLYRPNKQQFNTQPVQRRPFIVCHNTPHRYQHYTCCINLKKKSNFIYLRFTTLNSWGSF
uniref:Uncharacterized protein n=1 Tax=Denticeps clupeoides TaxID=299321 RepID=A0AAY4EQZ6_9TELE